LSSMFHDLSIKSSKIFYNIVQYVSQIANAQDFGWQEREKEEEWQVFIINIAFLFSFPFPSNRKQNPERY